MGVPEALNFEPISVIVITYNEAHNIRDCLDSLLAQAYLPEKYEIIGVDSSDDETPEIVRQYERVKLVRSEKGFSQQRNKGLQVAQYEIVAFTDADCIVPPDWLRVINQAFKEERIAALGGNAFPPPGTNRFGLWVACVGHPAGGAIGFDANIKRTERGIHFVAGCNSAFRKNALLAVGGFDPDFYDGGEDVDISRRLRQQGYYLAYIPECTVYHKPRTTLRSYARWNIQVGITKYNLNPVSLFHLIIQPNFPLWSTLIFFILFYLFISEPIVAIFMAAGLWLSFLLLLYVGARPFTLLIKRRRRIGVSLFPILTIIPFLIWLRQVCINVGQIRKWKKVCSSTSH